MNYDLVKKLKEARFPNLDIRENGYVNHPTIEIVNEPSLSELIEACGDKICIRLQSYYSENDLMWQADTSGNFIISDKQISSVDSTPEEAVANLWLELNKK